MYEGLNNRQKLKAELETTLALDPEYFSARLAYGRLLLSEGQTDKAAEQLKKLKKMQPDNTGVQRLEASLAKAQGKQQKAVELYTEIFEESTNKTSMLDLARQKWSVGDKEYSLNIQEKWVSEHHEDIAAKITLANSYVLDDRIDDAIKLYQQILAADENNLVALNNLAWHLRDSDPKQALAYATKASKLSPGSAATIDTLAVILFKNGDIESAQRKIEKALAYAPNDPTIRYHSAMIKEAAGYKTESIKTLTTLLGENIDFPEKSEARRLLERLQSGG
jgi:tetratricopeptide (TPR) repeat protein